MFSLKEQLALALEENGIKYQDEQLKQLEDYIRETLKWNKVYNLTGIKSEKDFILKNIIDSLSILGFLNADNILDVGTGAGLPGIPLAIFNPQKQFTLLDSSQKKITFLRNLVSLLGINNVNLVCSRVEEFQGSFDCITSRAFADIQKMLNLAGHLCEESGFFLAMKGKISEASKEITPNGFVVEEIVKLQVPKQIGERTLVIARKLKDKG